MLKPRTSDSAGAAVIAVGGLGCKVESNYIYIYMRVAVFTWGAERAA